MRCAQYAIIAIPVVSMLVFTLPGSVHAPVTNVPCPTSSTPTTIQSAIDLANDNDTISVSSSCTYFERLRISKPLHLIGASRDSTFIDGQGLGTVIWVNSSNVEIRGFTIQNSDLHGWGVHVEHANNVSITDNTISASPEGDGVNLYKANNTLINNNIFASNLYAVNTTSSESELITNNQATLNDTVGVQLQFSQKSLVFNNTFAGGEDGVDLVQSLNNNVSRNLVKGMKVYGIWLVPSSPSTATSQFSQNNIISENTFQRNHIGINLQNATLNIFYHNDFFASGFHQANAVAGTIVSPNYWDNGTLGGFPGGNYWDDYTGTDSDGDGIGDTPYVIDASNHDQRPLMAPFLPVSVLIKTVQASPLKGSVPLTVGLSAEVLGTYTPFTYRWDFGDGSPVASSASATHTFSQARNYTVTLIVGDASGATDFLSTQVQVTVPPSGLYAVIIVIGVAAVAAVSGFFLWRRRGTRRVAVVPGC